MKLSQNNQTTSHQCNYYCNRYLYKQSNNTNNLIAYNNSVNFYGYQFGLSNNGTNPYFSMNVKNNSKKSNRVNTLTNYKNYSRPQLY